jgi:hypothetical protein
MCVYLADVWQDQLDLWTKAESVLGVACEHGLPQFWYMPGHSELRTELKFNINYIYKKIK